MSDSFLADLDELSDNEIDAPNEAVYADEMDEDVDGEFADVEALNYDDLDSVSKLHKTQRYANIMQDTSRIGQLPDDVLLHIMSFLTNLKELAQTSVLSHRWKDLWLYTSRLDFDVCDLALALDETNKKVLNFVSSRIGYIAPNLSAMVGTVIAAKLMGAAGGLSALAKMPSCNVRLLGAKKKNLAGFSTATSQLRIGYMEQSELVKMTPPHLAMRAHRLVAAKLTLASRVDFACGDPTGKIGRNLKEEIQSIIAEWQEHAQPPLCA